MLDRVEPSTTHFRPDLFDPDRLLLSAGTCTECGQRAYPVRPYCWRCRAAMRAEPSTGIGTLRAVTRVRVSPVGFPDDYPVGLVDTDDGVRVIGRVVEDGATLAPGDRLRLSVGEIRSTTEGVVLGPVFISDPDVSAVRANPSAAQQPTQAAGPHRSQRPRPPVYVAGVGQTAFGRHQHSAEELAAQAVLDAIGDSGLDPARISTLIVGTAFGARALGQRVAALLPLSGAAVLNVENACASGTSALVEAAIRIRAGADDAVVAVGVDTPVASGGGLIELSADDPVAGLGVTLPALYALVGADYLTRSGAGAEALAEVVVRSRAAAQHNPLAARRKLTTRTEVLDSRLIADPLTLFQCAANADGAAAVVVTGAQLRPADRPTVEIAALELSAGLTKDRFSSPSAAERVGALAYAAAGLTPADVDVVECHDAFAPAVFMALESLGLAEPGTAADRLLAGDFQGGAGGAALNPSGGLLSRGHPPGATGLAQIAELTHQLRGEAGARQIDGARVGLVHSQGGTVLDLETNACVVGLLIRGDR